MIQRETIDRIIDRAEILDVVGDFVSLRKHGRDYIGLCPFHDDTRPSFHVSPQKNLCKCFACGEGGNPLSFIMKHEHLSFPEAIKYLGRKYGIEVEEKELTPEEKEAMSEREKLLSANSFARDFFVSTLHNDAEGRRIGLSYFRERGLKDETIKEFELGYSPVSYTALADRVRAEGEDPDPFEKTGLLIRRDDGSYIDRYRDRVIYPIHSVSGNVVGFGGRILVKKENTGKYVNSPASVIYDKSRELYGLYQARKELSVQDSCLVLEGYMDVISMHQSGVKNVVASSGTALTLSQVRIIKRYTSNLILIFDSDAAGVKAALRGLDVGFELDMNVSVVLLPDGEDPDSYAQKHSKDEIESYITDHLVDGLAFKEQMLRKELGDGVQARSEIITHLADSLSHHRNEVTRELYVSDLAHRYGISQQALANQVEQMRRQVLQEQYRSREREKQRETSSDFRIVRKEDEGELTAPTSTTSYDKKEEIQDPLNTYEEMLLGHILKEGTRVILRLPDREGHEDEFSTFDVISMETQDLREAGVLSRTFEEILDQVESEIQDREDPDLVRLLTWNENPTILYYAGKEMQKDFSLSPLHKSFIEEEETEEASTKRVMRDILSFKYAYILGELTKVLEELHHFSTEEGAEEKPEVRALLSRFQELSSRKNFLAEKLGERVINPSSLFQE